MSPEDETSMEEAERPPVPRPQVETLLYRAIRLRCPRCGKGRLYRNWFGMNRRCSNCHFLINRQSGYYLGSIYINYGLTALIVTVAFMICRVGLLIPGEKLAWPLAAFCILFPLVMFRFARALWLAMDCQFDRSVLAETEEDESGHA